MCIKLISDSSKNCQFPLFGRGIKGEVKKRKPNFRTVFSLITFSFTMLLCNIIYAQPKINTTEIWLIDVVNESGKIEFGKAERITDNDRYDNQPFFSRDGKYMYFASMPDSMQSDIFEYNIGKKLTRPVTNTPESEYQPQPILTDKTRLSVVRVDMDKAQRFYSINLDGTEADPLTENEDSVVTTARSAAAAGHRGRAPPRAPS